MKTEKINKETGLKLHSQTKSTKMSTNCMKTPHMKTTKTSKTKNSTTEQQEHPHASQPTYTAPMKIATRKPKTGDSTLSRIPMTSTSLMTRAKGGRNARRSRPKRLSIYVFAEGKEELRRKFNVDQFPCAFVFTS